jgi:hypothetical protein
LGYDRTIYSKPRAIQKQTSGNSNYLIFDIPQLAAGLFIIKEN